MARPFEALEEFCGASGSAFDRRRFLCLGLVLHLCGTMAWSCDGSVEMGGN
jgi:hypothetical protein